MANVQLAKNLRTLRKKYNYTQKQLSSILNITRQAYSHYEQALREPGLCTLIRVSDFYKITLDELVAGVIDADQIQESFPSRIVAMSFCEPRSCYQVLSS